MELERLQEELTRLGFLREREEADVLAIKAQAKTQAKANRDRKRREEKRKAEEERQQLLEAERQAVIGRKVEKQLKATQQLQRASGERAQARAEKTSKFQAKVKQEQQNRLEDQRNALLRRIAQEKERLEKARRLKQPHKDAARRQRSENIDQGQMVARRAHGFQPNRMSSARSQGNPKEGHSIADNGAGKLSRRGGGITGDSGDGIAARSTSNCSSLSRH